MCDGGTNAECPYDMVIRPSREVHAGASHTGPGQSADLALQCHIAYIIRTVALRQWNAGVLVETECQVDILQALRRGAFK